jgi:hypothetical protein
VCKFLVQAGAVVDAKDRLYYSRPFFLFQICFTFFSAKERLYTTLP